MLVKVNGEEIDLPENSTIRDAIERADAPYNPKSIISLIKGKKEFEQNITKYKIKTPKGNIIIELVSNANKLTDLWRNSYKEFKNKKIRWTTSKEIAVGPIVTQLTPSTEEFKYRQGDVILSLSGFSNESTHLIIFKEDSAGTYSTPEINQGIFAKVIGGKRTLNNLISEDHIIEIEGVVEKKSITDSAHADDLNTILEEGNQIFTYVLVEPTQDSPQSVEHLFSLIENDMIKVDYESNSFLGFYRMEGLGKDVEYSTMRKRGSVTLRNTGKGIGKVYIYREDRVQSPAHTHIGFVKVGMELIDIANTGDFITIKTDPERIMTMTMTQKEASEFLSIQNIEQIREGVLDDDALVVSQDPISTIDILKEKKVKTTGIVKDNLILVDIYNEDAPRSSMYFKKVTNIIEKPIGTLKVHFTVSNMKISIFEGNTKEAKGLIPENTPMDKVYSGTLGITNMSRKNVGLIGVRFEDNNEYGPTAEPFDGTNIVGKIKTGFKVIEKLKDGDIIYLKEN
ncbi:MAG: methanogenesis marker 3 protein [Methanobrevibacter sp.]|jgi:putative methanogenesis marker protein 3|nr:methanogenesis marker 3 protein [Candidatus Methanovirga basalitermitum]